MAQVRTHKRGKTYSYKLKEGKVGAKLNVVEKVDFFPYSGGTKVQELTPAKLDNWVGNVYSAVAPYHTGMCLGEFFSDTQN